ncbi:PEP-CTERM sorting domain-containing protein [Verrucomicrobiaceae bacterium N1E253]|uniref:PEP-CTERM sorting domain-containing protein n=1 Tax=Oceaniferula marina TaxID=2748318 RepID=A0A851GNR8_9BACT|nr:PEP-CTERM sorting domain-containing protein [Oceaniferula marina]NWK56677.1 PEP-CTERM sorting domain-containing protein [Oceaniferula marina]
MKKTTLILAAIAAGGGLSQAATIAFEAEDFASVSGSPTFNTVVDANASGGSAITASDNSYAATATYSLNVTTATNYTLYIRVFAPSSGDDSMFVPTQSDYETMGSPTVEINNLSNGNNLTYRWVNTNAGTFVGETGDTSGVLAPIYDLPAGVSDFTIRAREDGLLIDGFVFDTDGGISDPAVLDASLAAVPEPSSLALLGLGGLALVFRRRK